MPIPYLGSKRKSAGKIYQAIRNLEPDADTLVDLFCGGWAISEYFFRKGWKVIANDKNKYVIALLKKTIYDSLDEEKVLRFITRDDFNKVVGNADEYDDWYVGYVMCVWSFGNNQVGYMFGKESEPYKLAGHELVINKNVEMIKRLIPNIPQKYIDGILKQDSWHKRRTALNVVSRRLKTRILELQQLERLQQLEQLERLQQLEQLERLQQLERLEQLEQLERLERLERLELSALDYRDVSVPDNAVVYCDPPYQGTAEYKEGGFNHSEFWDWVRVVSKKNPVYISEYNSPDDFKAVLRFQQKSTYAGGKNDKQPDERLFTMRKKVEQPAG
jgi:site-specific DNA-adenine methylase